MSVRVRGFHGSSFMVKKKKAFSNKQATKEIRALKGKEGDRKHLSALLNTAATLTAGTPVVSYFDDSSLFSTDTVPHIHHYYNVRIELQAAAVSYVRIIYGFDVDYDGTNLVASQILATTTNSASGYALGEAAPRKECIHKNQGFSQRAQIVWDQEIGLEANRPVVLNKRLPLYNMRTNASVNDSVVKFYPFMLYLADSANATLTCGVDYFYTALN